MNRLRLLVQRLLRNFTWLCRFLLGLFGFLTEQRWCLQMLRLGAFPLRFGWFRDRFFVVLRDCRGILEHRRWQGARSIVDATMDDSSTDGINTVGKLTFDGH